MLKTILLATAALVGLSGPMDAKELRYNPEVQQLYLCYHLADTMGDARAAIKFLRLAEYKARASGWSNSDVDFFKGYIYGKNEDKLEQSRYELARMYANLACDQLSRMPIVTRDE
jgi:hypothetical protein